MFTHIDAVLYDLRKMLSTNYTVLNQKSKEAVWVINEENGALQEFTYTELQYIKPIDIVSIIEDQEK